MYYMWLICELYAMYMMLVLMNTVEYSPVSDAAGDTNDNIVRSSAPERRVEICRRNTCKGNVVVDQRSNLTVAVFSGFFFVWQKESAPLKLTIKRVHLWFTFNLELRFYFFKNVFSTYADITIIYNLYKMLRSYTKRYYKIVLIQSSVETPS